MNFEPLAIFPEGSLASSLVVTVWIGVLVVCFFNLRFGWVLSALVAPGYLVPLAAIKPWAVVIILLESVVTYAIVVGMSAYFSRFARFASFFGRDRFFAFLLVSVLVRVTFDGWLLPDFGAWLNDRFELAFNYRNNLHSFGLIIIALLANLFFKTGVVRGLATTMVNIAVTWLIIRFVLVDFTNFRLSGVGYLYEDVAASILAAPKAYIILLISAFVASRMNLYYGWEFSGILIPSLIALQWYQPMKVLMTFVEAFFIMGVGRWVLATPFFKRTTMEGARLVALFFTISFLYKMAEGWLIGWLWPTVKPTDYFAFGYLLASLMAAKMHEKEIAVRLTRATVQVSLVAVGIASVIGFALTYVPNPLDYGASRTVTANAKVGVDMIDEATFIDVVRAAKVSSYMSRLEDATPIPTQWELDSFRAGVRALLDYVESGEAERLDLAAARFAEVNFKLSRVEGKYLVISEIEPRGWGFYAINLEPKNETLVQAPAPVEEWGAMEGGAWLFVDLQTRSYAAAGAARNSNKDGSADALQAYRLPFFVFYQVMGRADTLQVRGFEGAPDDERKRERDGVNYLAVKRRLPPGLDLARLKQDVEKIDVEWGAAWDANLYRKEARGGLAELYLTRNTIRKLMFKPFFNLADIPLEAKTQRIDGYLQDWILSQKDRIAPSGSDRYVAPRIEQMLFIDELIVTPLLKIVRSEFKDGTWSETGEAELKALASYAATLDMTIIQYRHRESGNDYLVMAEKGELRKPRFWGTYIFRLGDASPYVIQAPRPIFEVNSFEYAVYLFERLGARALLIGGSHPSANQDYSADIVKRINKVNVFNLVGQAIARESGDEPLMYIQCRAFGLRPDREQPNVDAVVGLDNWAYDADNVKPLARRLLDALDEDGMIVRFADSKIDTAGYEVGSTAQVGYLSALPGKEFSLLWISPLARASYRQQTENRMQEAKFASADIPLDTASLAGYIHSFNRWSPTGQLPERMRGMLRDFVFDKDVILLTRMRADFPDFTFRRLIDINSKQTFIVVIDSTGALVSIINVVPRQPQVEILLDNRESVKEKVEAFIETRASWLYFQQKGGQS
ncbi:MAG: poly-gamma-glutamate biosynthesis protein PgsC/CapC [Nitrospinae bacterium]|nr:poly-gamma-glutamate biosynthesis protein PgsC/CapC [Nitrospinota bacterium]